jgi:hypothetical protein
LIAFAQTAAQGVAFLRSGGNLKRRFAPMEQISESTPRVWSLLSWLFVLALLGLGVWWLFSLPTVGKGGLFLALGAVLMPLFWEKIGVAGKMSWIAMLFVLLAVEYRAIDKEHRDNIEAQKQIGEGFKNVLTDQQEKFSTLIQQSQTQFQETVQKQQEQFRAMLGGFTKVTGMQHEQLSKADELLTMPSSRMPCKDLAENAQEITNRMRAIQRGYIVEDQRIDLPIWNEMMRGGQTDGRREELRREEQRKQADLRSASEAPAKAAIVIANQFRAEMVKRLVPAYGDPEDSTRQAWFEKPTLPLDKLPENAAYLDDLTKRMMFSCEGP